MGAKYTQAQAQATKKYLSKFAEIRIRMSPDEKKIIETAAHQAGLSVNQYIKGVLLGK